MPKTTVATQDKKFELVTLQGEIAENIAAEMDGLGTLPFDTVKIPSGGGLTFEIPGEDEDEPDVVTEIRGVILYHYPVNAYWRDAYNGTNVPPDCASMDGKKGIRQETGEIIDCASCPHNQFGSEGKGKACKNTHRCYILREGNPIPLLLTLPPTSLKYLRNYLGKKILLKGLRSFDAITKITLKKEKSSGGITYSRAAFSFGGLLDEQQRIAAREMAETIKNMTQPDITVNDYNVPSAAPNGGFTEADIIDGEDIPF